MGSKKAITRCLPQAKIIWEFRYNDHQISYDFREEVCDPLFVAIDHIWKIINDKNASIPVPENAYIFSILTFNEIVIREAILNAIAHRDYIVNSEVVIHQFPHQLIITNSGGFPRGVDKDNLISSSSTPRSRLMAEVMEKTGLVERSGQGIDKIYSITLSEGKGEPDYQDSSIFQVTLKLNGVLKDQAFSLFIHLIQASKPNTDKLGVHEILALYLIKEGQFARIKPDILKKLEAQQLIVRHTNSNRYSLSNTYSSLITDNRIGNRYLITELELILPFFKGKNLKISELEIALATSLNRNQIKYLISKLQEDNILATEGQKKGTRYKIIEPFDNLTGAALSSAVIALLRDRYQLETEPSRVE